MHAEKLLKNLWTSGLFWIFTEKFSWNLVTYHFKYVFTLKITKA